MVLYTRQLGECEWGVFTSAPKMSRFLRLQFENGKNRRLSGVCSIFVVFRPCFVILNASYCDWNSAHCRRVVFTDSHRTFTVTDLNRNTCHSARSTGWVFALNFGSQFPSPVVPFPFSIVAPWSFEAWVNSWPILSIHYCFRIIW